MKTLLKIRACFCAALMILTACATIQAAPVAPTVASLATLAPTETSVSTPGPGRLETDEITSQALAGNLLGDPATRKFQVYLPSGYDTSNHRYPVVYVLHLYPGDYMSFSGQTPRSLETLIAGDKVEPMILVFPDAYNKLGGSMYWSSPTIGDYETYITRELVQQIDATYRTPCLAVRAAALWDARWAGPTLSTWVLSTPTYLVL
jgi:hypothetical protein